MGSYAGIDWASEKHDVLIADERGGQLLAETFMHDEQGIAALCDALTCFALDVVAIERGSGVLVERLLDAGVRVLALHPNQVSPADTRGLGEKRMAAFLKAHRYARKTPAQLLERLRAAPSGRAGEIETRTRRAIVTRLVHTLQVLVEQIHGLDTEIGEALDAHPDGEIFRSFFKTDSTYRRPGPVAPGGGRRGAGSAGSAAAR